MKVILLLLTAAAFNLSYRNGGKKAVREIIVNSGDSVIVAHLPLNESKVKTSPRKTYYWHRQGKIFHNAGDYGGTLLENSYQVFLDGKLIVSGEFHKGTKNGTWFFWNDDGTLDNVLYYRKGILKNKEFKSPEEKRKLQIWKRDKEKPEKRKLFGRKTKDADENVDDGTDENSDDIEEND